MVHTKELTLRDRANEKVVASVSLLGVIACTFVGAGYFAPKAEAHMGHPFPTNQWINEMREWDAQQTRTSPEDSINNALADMEEENGSDDPTKSQELLQLPSDGD